MGTCPARTPPPSVPYFTKTSCTRDDNTEQFFNEKVFHGMLSILHLHFTFFVVEKSRLFKMDISPQKSRFVGKFKLTLSCCPTFIQGLRRGTCLINKRYLFLSGENCCNVPLKAGGRWLTVPIYVILYNFVILTYVYIKQFNSIDYAAIISRTTQKTFECFPY